MGYIGNGIAGTQLIGLSWGLKPRCGYATYELPLVKF